MRGEIDKDFYCSLITHGNGNCSVFGQDSCGRNCHQRHRKHPTREQYREEYGENWNGAVYYHCSNSECDTECKAKEWGTEKFGCLNNYDIICASTPFGPPPKGWRPQ